VTHKTFDCCAFENSTRRNLRFLCQDCCYLCEEFRAKKKMEFVRVNVPEKTTFGESKIIFNLTTIV
jgi:hypothetical protein